jgi:hypothetical protein
MARAPPAPSPAVRAGPFTADPSHDFTGCLSPGPALRPDQDMTHPPALPLPHNKPRSPRLLSAAPRELRARGGGRAPAPEAARAPAQRPCGRPRRGPIPLARPRRADFPYPGAAPRPPQAAPAAPRPRPRTALRLSPRPAAPPAPAPGAARPRPRPQEPHGPRARRRSAAAPRPAPPLPHAARTRAACCCLRVLSAYISHLLTPGGPPEPLLSPAAGAPCRQPLARASPSR